MHVHRAVARILKNAQIGSPGFCNVPLSQKSGQDIRQKVSNSESQQLASKILPSGAGRDQKLSKNRTDV